MFKARSPLLTILSLGLSILVGFTLTRLMGIGGQWLCLPPPLLILPSIVGLGLADMAKRRHEPWPLVRQTALAINVALTCVSILLFLSFTAV